MSGAVFLVGFFRGARTKQQPSGVRKEGGQFAFQSWPVQQSELHRHVVEAAGREAAIEMTQARNQHPDDGNLDIGPCLVEHEEIIACTGGDLDAGNDLVPRIVVQLEAWRRRDDRALAWSQERIIFQA